MKEPAPYLHDWWRWWGNPLINIHESQLIHLPYAREQLKDIDYLHFLEIRSTIGLPDLPDRHLVERNQIRSLAISNPEKIGAVFNQVGVLSLGPSILHASAQKWEQHYGVSSPDQVREIIKWRNEIPHGLKPWRESLLITLDQGDAYSMKMPTRALLGLGAYLQSFYPEFYKRFELTLSYEITLILKSVDPIPQEAQSICEVWFEPMLNEIHKQTLADYPDDEIETFEMIDDEEVKALDNLNEINPWLESENA